MTESEIHAEFYRTFVKNSKNGFWLAQVHEPVAINTSADKQIEHLFDKALIVDCNEAFAMMYGFTSPAELLNTPILKFLVREDKRNLDVIHSFIRSGYKVEKAITHETDRHGNPRWFLNDAFGKVEGELLISVCGIQQEVTDHIKTDLARESLLKIISPRQRVVLQLRSDGYAVKEIGKILNISYNTAHTHIARLKKHLGFSSDDVLVQYAVRLGLSTRRQPHEMGFQLPAKTQSHQRSP